MKTRFETLVFVLTAFLLVAGATQAQEIFKMQAHGIKLQVMSEPAFRAAFGDNPKIPRSDEAILTLAKQLYPPSSLKETVLPAAAEDAADCGEEDVGLLFAALRNPRVSDIIRRQVDFLIQDSVPPLPETYVSPSGHFKFYYTTNDANPLNNVTPAQIQDTAVKLDSYWTTYSNNFKKPKYYISGGQERIDVKVYYIGAGILSQTNSAWNFIELNSALCVQNNCKRQTASAHELFHRVQYSYGYVSGTPNMKWMVEGTAAWSQRYTNISIRDYMAYMNGGLSSPDVNLITGRSNNACHFWVFLQERSSYTAIRNVWATYQNNGKNAVAAVNKVVSNTLGLNFDTYAQKWHKANYIKDLTNASSGGYNYLENTTTQTSCGVTYGPLVKVPTIVRFIDADTRLSLSGTVNPYGADYYVFNLDSELQSLAVTVQGGTTGNWSFHFFGVKDGAYSGIVNTTAGKYTYRKTLTAGQYDQLVVVVTGRSMGGAYNITAGSCVAGTWVDNFGRTWTLQESGTTITGTRDSRAAGCGVVNVSGTYNAPAITLYTDVVVSGCCYIRWKGTVTNCNTIKGTWTQTGGARGCSGTGSFTMYKQTSASSPKEDTETGVGDPACGECKGP